MGRKSDRKGRIDLGGPTGGLSSNPFASLARSKPQSPEPEVAPEGLATGGTVARGTVEVRFERKGRGGKEVTVARWLSTPPDEEALERIARGCAKALGAGARVEADSLVIQGRQVDRVASHLETVCGLSVTRGAS